MAKWRPVEVLDCTKKILAVPETVDQLPVRHPRLPEELTQKELDPGMEGFGVEAVERQEGGK